ncbi:MAG: M20/M25/M40 family metallo-hydrolase [Promethearchaeota archaeon]|jgi:succinyl-diaminopimelate desuccinylase
MSSITNFENLIKKSNKKFIESDLQPFLRIPSSTLNRKGISNAKNFLISYISDFCKEVKIYEGELNPLILAKIDGKRKESLLIYMMYDTQPISNERDWICKPFRAEIRILPPPLNALGDCIIARGAYNSKTPLLCFISVVKELKNRNELPISLILLFDGEEEIGSPSLRQLLVTNKNLFKDCIDVYYPSAKQDLNGNSILKLGYKGILSLTIKVTSQNKEPHSAFSAIIPNPAADLTSLLNTIYVNHKFCIDSLNSTYNISKDEQLLFDKLIGKMDIEKMKDKAGIVQLCEDNPKTALKKYFFYPTFNISTLKAGFLEEGVKNYVANHAVCKIDIRFAHNISVNDIYQEIREKVEKFSKTSKSKIEIIKNGAYEGSRVRKDSRLVKSLIKSGEILGVATELWPLSAAAAPLTQIQKVLELNFVTGGLGIGGYAHSANEFIQYDSISNIRLSNYHFLRIYSQFLNEENIN